MATSGPWSVGAFGNAIDSNGYRVNSALRQRNINATLSYTTPNLGAYSTVVGDRQFQGLPAGLNNLPGSFPFTLDTPWQSNTPLDWGKKQGNQFRSRVKCDAQSGHRTNRRWQRPTQISAGAVLQLFRSQQWFRLHRGGRLADELRRHSHDHFVSDATTRCIASVIRASEPVADRDRFLQHAIQFGSAHGAWFSSDSQLRHSADNSGSLRNEHYVGAARHRRFNWRPHPAQYGQSAGHLQPGQ